MHMLRAAIDAFALDDRSFAQPSTGYWIAPTTDTNQADLRNTVCINSYWTSSVDCCAICGCGDANERSFNSAAPSTDSARYACRAQHMYMYCSKERRTGNKEEWR